MLTEAGGRFDRTRFESLCAELARAAAGRELVLVSSGAVALGVERLGLKTRPKDIRGKAGRRRGWTVAADAALRRCARPQGVTVAQVLLTHADVQSRTRYLNARHAIFNLLSHRALPIINENDTVSVEELKFGDNDTLAGMAVDLVEADLLIILTDIDGLTPPTRARTKARRAFPKSTASMPRRWPWPATRSGRGHRRHGQQAARRQPSRRVRCPDADRPRQAGRRARCGAGRGVAGTFVHAPPPPEGGRRKRWLLRDLRPTGELRIDDGAARALREQGKSLLPSGVREVQGTFEAGEPVAIVTLSGELVARGLPSYGSDELRRLLAFARPDRRAPGLQARRRGRASR